MSASTSTGQPGFKRRGGIGGSVQIELDQLADPGIGHPGPAQPVQGTFDGLALDVEHAGLEEDVNLDPRHQCSPP